MLITKGSFFACLRKRGHRSVEDLRARSSAEETAFNRAASATDTDSLCTHVASPDIYIDARQTLSGIRSSIGLHTCHLRAGEGFRGAGRCLTRRIERRTTPASMRALSFTRISLLLLGTTLTKCVKNTPLSPQVTATYGCPSRQKRHSHPLFLTTAHHPKEAYA